MELHNINRDSMDRCMTNVISAIHQGRHSNGEVILAMAELLGRIIVDLCDTPVSGMQAGVEIEKHIQRTMYAGYTARGFNMGPMEL